VDGTNVGVHFEEPWVPVPQKRSGLILQGEHEQYVRFRDFCFEHVEALWNALSTRYVLFGEWLLVQHGVVYDRLSSFFIAFDVLDKTDGSFLSTKAMAELLKDSGVETVPLLATAWNGTTKQLEELVKTSRFSTSETCEGVYIRFETDARCVERLKYRRKTFTAGRTDFATRVAYNKVKSNKSPLFGILFRCRSHKLSKALFFHPRSGWQNNLFLRNGLPRQKV
jgi:atypical dual specificity phosphatase